MGLDTVSESQERVLIRNQHMQLLDPATRSRYQSYLDTEFVGDQYKQGRYYYSLSAAIAAPPTVGAIEKSSASTQQSVRKFYFYFKRLWGLSSIDKKMIFQTLKKAKKSQNHFKFLN